MRALFATWCLLGAFLAVGRADLASLLQGESEAAVLEYLPAMDAGELKRSSAAKAAQRGWFDAATRLTELSGAAGMDIENDLKMAARTVEGKMKKLQKLLKTAAAAGAGGGASAIAPALEWAQSPDSVFVGVKYAHKIDAPAAIGVKTDVVDIQESAVRVEATHPTKRFALSLPLAGEVVPEESTWSESSAGRMTMVLRKAEVNSTWAGLVTGKKPANAHIWWALHEEHEEANEKAEGYMRAQRKAARKDEAKDESKDEPEAKEDPEPEQKPKEAEEKPQAPDDPVARELDATERRLARELKARLRELDDDARKRKRDVDEEAKAAKQAVDQETAARRKEIEAEAAAEKEAALAAVRDRGEEL